MHSFSNALLSTLLLFGVIYSTHGRRDNLSATRVNSTNTTHTENSSKNSSSLRFTIGSAGHDIVFPGEDYVPVVYQRFPERLKGERDCVEHICEEVDDYPSDYILNSLKGMKVYDDYFKDTVIPIDIADRNNFDDEETLCRTRKHTSFPKTAVNVNKTKRVIVNVEPYQQALVFETCMENTKCKFSEMFPNDYEVACKQRYTIRRLMALNDDEKPAFDSFEVPSCCVCTFKKKT